MPLHMSKILLLIGKVANVNFSGWKKPNRHGTGSDRIRIQQYILFCCNIGYSNIFRCRKKWGSSLNRRNWIWESNRDKGHWPLIPRALFKDSDPNKRVLINFHDTFLSHTYLPVKVSVHLQTRLHLVYYQKVFGALQQVVVGELLHLALFYR